jgi:hypothetical protein
MNQRRTLRPSPAERALIEGLRMFSDDAGISRDRTATAAGVNLLDHCWEDYLANPDSPRYRFQTTEEEFVEARRAQFQIVSRTARPTPSKAQAPRFLPPSPPCKPSSPRLCVVSASQ